MREEVEAAIEARDTLLRSKVSINVSGSLKKQTLSKCLLSRRLALLVGIEIAGQDSKDAHIYIVDLQDQIKHDLGSGRRVKANLDFLINTPGNELKRFGTIDWSEYQRLMEKAAFFAVAI